MSFKEKTPVAPVKEKLPEVVINKVEGTVKNVVEGNVNHNSKVDGGLTIKIDGIHSLDHSIKTLDQLGNKVSELVTAHGTKTVSTVLDAAHGKVVHEFMSGLICLVLAIVFAVFARKSHYDYTAIGALITIPSVVLSFVMFLVAASTLSNPNLYKAMERPEIYIAEKLLTKVIR